MAGENTWNSDDGKYLLRIWVMQSRAISLSSLSHHQQWINQERDPISLTLTDLLGLYTLASYLLWASHCQWNNNPHLWSHWLTLSWSRSLLSITYNRDVTVKAVDCFVFPWRKRNFGLWGLHTKILVYNSTLPKEWSDWANTTVIVFLAISFTVLVLLLAWVHHLNLWNP